MTIFMLIIILVSWILLGIEIYILWYFHRKQIKRKE
jgi:heme/copper-type cytochrome/quinol oxidase subunit 2